MLNTKMSASFRCGTAVVGGVLLTISLLIPRSASAAPARGADASPVGGSIVFGRFVPAIGDFHLFTADPDGSDRRLLLRRPAECPRWAPDASVLAVCVVGSQGLLRPATVEPDGSNFRILHNPDRSLNLACSAWAPDASRLYCEAWDDSAPGRNGIYSVRSTDGGGLRRLSSNPYGGHDVPGDVSPDGSRIDFVRSRPGIPQDELAVFTMAVGGGDIGRITPFGAASCCGSRWSPDGDTILLTTPDGKLATVHPDGSHLRVIAIHPGTRHWAFAASWSPDGSRIVFSLSLGGPADIYTSKRSGTDLVRVTTTPNAEEDLADWATPLT